MEIAKDQRQSSKRGWRVKEWARDVGVSVSSTHELIQQRRIKSVKLGHARIILTPPEGFLAELAEVA